MAHSMLSRVILEHAARQGVKAAFFSLVLLFSGTAGAQERAHDGFFLQMDLGIGGMASSADGGAGDVEYSGGAGEFSIGIGGAVAENLILAGQLWAVSVVDPTVKVDGRDLGTADATLSLSGIGFNVTYYLMPSNIYFSATPSLTTLTAEQGGRTDETDTGFGLRLAIGKEWWVSDNWGLGLNGQLIVSSNDYPDGDTWGTGWIGVAFSATFN